MPTSATGKTPRNKPLAADSGGFTLLEILIVLFIMSLVVTSIQVMMLRANVQEEM